MPSQEKDAVIDKMDTPDIRRPEVEVEQEPRVGNKIIDNIRKPWLDTIGESKPMEAPGVRIVQDIIQMNRDKKEQDNLAKEELKKFVDAAKTSKEKKSIIANFHADKLE